MLVPPLILFDQSEYVLICLSNLKKDSSSNLSKIAVMLLVISDVCFPRFEEVLACKETSYGKASNLYKR